MQQSHLYLQFSTTRLIDDTCMTVAKAYLKLGSKKKRKKFSNKLDVAIPTNRGSRAGFRDTLTLPPPVQTHSLSEVCRHHLLLAERLLCIYRGGAGSVFRCVFGSAFLSSGYVLQRSATSVSHSGSGWLVSGRCVWEWRVKGGGREVERTRRTLEV